MMVDGISTINSCQKNNRLNENEFKKHTVGQKIRPDNGVYNYLQINNRLIENEFKMYTVWQKWLRCTYMMVDGIPTINSCKINNRLPENELKTYTVGQKMPRSHDF